MGNRADQDQPSSLKFKTRCMAFLYCILYYVVAFSYVCMYVHMYAFSRVGVGWGGNAILRNVISPRCSVCNADTIVLELKGTGIFLCCRICCIYQCIMYRMAFRNAGIIKLSFIATTFGIYYLPMVTLGSHTFCTMNALLLHQYYWW